MKNISKLSGLEPLFRSVGARREMNSFPDVAHRLIETLLLSLRDATSLAQMQIRRPAFADSLLALVTSISHRRSAMQNVLKLRAHSV